MPEAIEKAKIVWVKIERVGRNAPLIEEWNEDGPYTREAEGIAIYAMSDYGILYTNRHSFEDDNDVGWAKLQKALDAITLHLHNGGALNPDHWGVVRVCYGTNAYLDWVEPELVRMDKDPNYMPSALALP